MFFLSQVKSQKFVMKTLFKYKIRVVHNCCRYVCMENVYFFRQSHLNIALFRESIMGYRSNLVLNSRLALVIGYRRRAADETFYHRIT